MITYLHIVNGEVKGEIEQDPTDITCLPPCDGKFCHELIRKDRMETTLKAALSLATTAEVFGKMGLVDKRAEVKPISKKW